MSDDSQIDAKAEILGFYESNWTAFCFMDTPGFEKTFTRPGVFDIPEVYNWFFSPRGLLGVSIAETKDGGFDIFLLDVHNRLWSAHSFTRMNLQYKDIYTYHMLDETTLIVVEILNNDMSGLTSIKQHVVYVNLETRIAEFIQTVDYPFRPRPLNYNEDDWDIMDGDAAPAYVTVDGKDYTALVSNMFNNRRVIYLVPRNPLNPHIQPMEFMISTELTTENLRNLKNSAGLPSDTEIVFSCDPFSWSNLLYFASIKDDVNHHLVLQGVYLTVDVAKLIDIYNKPDGANANAEQMSRDRQQGEAVKLISVSMEKKVVDNQCYIECGIYGAMQYTVPLPSEKNISTCYVFGSNYTMQIQCDKECWLNMHPCGAILQFKMGKYAMYVKAVKIYKNTLESIATTKALFQQKWTIGTIEGLHQMVFHRLKPIPLDENAKKFLRKYEEYKKKNT